MNLTRRLHHDVPSWVDRSGAVFHIRIRVAAMNSISLTEPSLAPELLSSVVEYSRRKVWWPVVFLLMPDHVPRFEGDPGGKQGFAYCFGYIQAALQLVRMEA